LKDKEFYNKLIKLQNVPPEIFEIKQDHRHVEVWKLIIKSKYKQNKIIELRKVQKCFTPKEKLLCYAEAYSIVVNSIEVFSKKKEAAGADDSMPIIIFLLM